MSERYEIQKKIGQGGIGAVYQAFDTQLKREVALKRMLPAEKELKGEEDAAAEMLKEATTLSSLSHPNIITVYDLGTDEDGAFVVMELLKGETLDETIKRSVLTVPDFDEVVCQSLEGLMAAQNVGLLHRDLKPTNLMVNWLPTGKFQVKILDFGLAKFSQTPSVQTVEHGDSILGSIYFMAPEQFERAPLDFRTDLYSIGCIFYQTLTGEYPFQGDTAPQVMASHLQNNFSPIEEIRPDIPAWISNWVAWLMSRQAKDRPKDAKDALFTYHQAQKTGYFVAPNQAQAAPPTVHGAPAPSIPTAYGIPAATPTAHGIPAATPTAHGAATPALTTQGVHLPNIHTAHAPVANPGLTQTGAVQGQVKNPLNAAASKKKLKGLTIALICLFVGLIGLISLVLVNNAKKNKIKEWKANFAEATTASATDARKALGIIEAAGNQPTKDSADMLNTLATAEGQDIDDTVLDFMAKTGTPTQIRLYTGVIAKRQPSNGEPLFQKLAQESPDKTVRNLSVQSLRMFGSQQSLRPLVGLLDKNEHDRSQVRAAILEVAKRTKSDGPIYSRYATAPADVKQDLLLIIGELGGNQAFKEIKSALNQPKMRDAAIMALQVWPDPKQGPFVKELIDKEKDEGTQTALYRAYLALAEKEGGQEAMFRSALKMAGESRRRKEDLIRSIGYVFKPWALEISKSMAKDSNKKVSKLAKRASTFIAKGIKEGAGKKKPGK